jgi:CDP-diglyceride synthetase
MFQTHHKNSFSFLFFFSSLYLYFLLFCVSFFNVTWVLFYFYIISHFPFLFIYILYLFFIFIHSVFYNVPVRDSHAFFCLLLFMLYSYDVPQYIFGSLHNMHEIFNSIFGSFM